MALFTESQANACTITKVKKITKGSSCRWGLGVKDADNNHYDWVDFTLSSSASKADVKAAVKARLLEMDKISASSAYSSSSEDNIGVEETVG